MKILKVPYTFVQDLYRQTVMQLITYSESVAIIIDLSPRFQARRIAPYTAPNSADWFVARRAGSIQLFLQPSSK